VKQDHRRAAGGSGDSVSIARRNSIDSVRAGTGAVAQIEEVERRARIRAAARANLAAMICEEYGVDATGAVHSPVALGRAAAAFAELTAVLGLTVDAVAAAAGDGGNEAYRT